MIAPFRDIRRRYQVSAPCIFLYVTNFSLQALSSGMRQSSSMIKIIVGTTMTTLHLRLPAGLLPTPHSQRSPPPRRPSSLLSSPLPAPTGPSRLSGRPLGALYKRPPGRWRPTSSLIVSGTAQDRGAGRLQRRPARCLAGSRSPSGLVSRPEASRGGEASPVPERGLGNFLPNVPGTGASGG